MAAEITPTSRIRILDDVLFQQLQGESVLLNLRSGVYLGLDKVGTRIWELLQEDGRLERVVSRMTDQFEVTESQCREDLVELVGRMEKEGLVEILPA